MIQDRLVASFNEDVVLISLVVVLSNRLLQRSNQEIGSKYVYIRYPRRDAWVIGLELECVSHLFQRHEPHRHLRRDSLRMDGVPVADLTTQFLRVWHVSEPVLESHPCSIDLLE